MILGMSELLVILVIVIFFYGGKRLSQVGEGLGKSISEFKKSIRSETTSSPEVPKELPTDKTP